MDPLLWDAAGQVWRFESSTGYYYCECSNCQEDPVNFEYCRREDLDAEYGPVSTTNPKLTQAWVTRVYGKHSDTRGLDEPAVTVGELLARENHFPSAVFEPFVEVA